MVNVAHCDICLHGLCHQVEKIVNIFEFHGYLIFEKYFSVKYLAFYGCVLTSCVLLRDFWIRIGDKSVKTKTLVMEFFIQV